MSTEIDQATPTRLLVLRLKDIDRRLRTARRNVKLLEHLHDEVLAELRRRAERAARLAGLATKALLT